MADVYAALAHFRKAREHIEKAEAALTSPDPAGRRVLDVVTGEMTLAGIVKATGLQHETVAQACSRLVKRGELRRVRHGVYAPRKRAGEGSP